MDFPDDSDGKESASSSGDLDSIPWLGRSPGEGNVYPLQYSCLGNPMDRGAWQATVYGLQTCPGGKDMVHQDPVLNVFLTVGLSSLRLRMTSLSLKVTKAIHAISWHGKLGWKFFALFRMNLLIPVGERSFSKKHENTGSMSGAFWFRVSPPLVPCWVLFCLLCRWAIFLHLGFS